MSKKVIFIAFVVSLGGFLFGFDAGIISGVMSYAGPEFNLSDGQTGWVVSSPSFAAMIAMLIAGRLSDVIGRKKILIAVAFLYAVSALASAYASSYEMLYIARMISVQAKPSGALTPYAGSLSLRTQSTTCSSSRT